MVRFRDLSPASKGRSRVALVNVLDWSSLLVDRIGEIFVVLRVRVWDLSIHSDVWPPRRWEDSSFSSSIPSGGNNYFGWSIVDCTSSWLVWHCFWTHSYGFCRWVRWLRTAWRLKGIQWLGDAAWNEGNALPSLQRLHAPCFHWLALLNVSVCSRWLSVSAHDWFRPSSDSSHSAV